MINLQELGLEIIKNNISQKCRIQFKDTWFTFYTDCSGQRGHYVMAYKPYDHKIIENHYIIKRHLSFINDIDVGKDKAVLGILNLEKCKIINIQEDKIEFENFTFHLYDNNSTQGINFEYI